MDISAITNVIMGIAAQGAVTVTIPNDSDLVRELGPVEMTRQIGPIELRIQTGPAGKAITAQPSTKAPTAPIQTAPAKPAPVESAPVETNNEAAPVQPKTETAPAPVETKNEAVPAPAVTMNEDAARPKAEAGSAVPAQVKPQAAPAKVASTRPAAEATREIAPAQETGFTGLWYDHTGRSAIKISECGEGLCGRIAWLKNSAHTSVCGTDIIGGVHKVGDLYDNGWIYDIDKGKKFDVELKLLSEQQLRVKGYLGSKLFSKTFVWNRAPADLQLCS